MKLRSVLGFNNMASAVLLEVSGNRSGDVIKRDVDELRDSVVAVARAAVDEEQQALRDKHFPPGVYPPGVLEEAEKLL